jgi:hypothetical protein
VDAFADIVALQLVDDEVHWHTGLILEFLHFRYNYLKLVS